ncbi:ABC transporter permease [Kutzneria buriramensis]|uniref:Ribose transport system permease protein n=1 Tax=Kutzneria buriramensis TaxID=1045776 RepID=A0A3E0GWM5_9PSEU|nr:ABC transporter permease [Kutzneria buriramensis]REH28573.1 ribose transport system permease protein [Kutzneria buriramensis]
MSNDTSVRSTALEPRKGTSRSRRVLVVYGMVLATLALFVLFAVLCPRTFPTPLNLRLITAGNAVPLVMALAVTVPMVAGKIDMSAGYALGLWQVMAVSLQIDGIDCWLAIPLVLVGGAVVGLANALLIELAKVDAFVATLATGQLIFAISYWRTGGRQLVDPGSQQSAYLHGLVDWSIGPVAGPFVLAVALTVVVWVVLEFFPVGRYLYVVGSNRHGAESTGIRCRHYVVGSMMAAGVLSALGGILLAARQAGIAQADIGPGFLLPALAAALIGSTTIRPGRVNAWGTLTGVTATMIGISGLQQVLPGQFYLEPLFTGLTLVAAIVIASLASHKRAARARQLSVEP